MKIESGFTIAQVTITVAITGVLAAVAVQSYQTYIAKAQAAEIGSLLTTQQVNAITDLKNGRCPSDKLFGKFGNVIGSGTFAMSNGASCQTGCELKYQFNTNGVARELQGKTVTVALLNSGETASVEAKTTLSDKYLKGVVFAKANIIGDSCTAITPTTPKTTAGGSLTGNEVGMAAPVIPDPTPPTPPAGGTTPTTPTPPPETPPVTPPITPPVTPPVDPDRVVMAFEQPATMRRWSVIDGYYVDAAAYLENSAITFNGVERYLSLINVNKVNTLLVEVFFDFDGVIEVSVPQAWVDTSIYSKVEFDLIMDNGATKHKFVLSKTMIVSYQRPSAVIFRMPDNKFTYFKMMENKINVPVKFSLTFVK